MVSFAGFPGKQSHVYKLVNRDSSNGGIRSASESWSVEDLAINPQFIIHPLRV